MSIPILVTGDDFALPVNLTVNGVAYPVDPGAAVTVGVISADHETRLLDGVAQSSTAAGANWAAGTVVVEFSEAETGPVASFGTALLEIQVSDGKKQTWFTPVTVVRGLIS